MKKLLLVSSLVFWCLGSIAQTAAFRRSSTNLPFVSTLESNHVFMVDRGGGLAPANITYGSLTNLIAGVVSSSAGTSTVWSVLWQTNFSTGFYEDWGSNRFMTQLSYTVPSNGVYRIDFSDILVQQTGDPFDSMLQTHVQWTDQRGVATKFLQSTAVPDSTGSFWGFASGGFVFHALSNSPIVISNLVAASWQIGDTLATNYVNYVLSRIDSTGGGGSSSSANNNLTNATHRGAMQFLDGSIVGALITPTNTYFDAGNAVAVGTNNASGYTLNVEGTLRVSGGITGSGIATGGITNLDSRSLTFTNFKGLRFEQPSPVDLYRWAEITNGRIIMPSWNTGRVGPSPGLVWFNTNNNLVGSIEVWSDHNGGVANTPEMLINSPQNIAIRPGDTTMPSYILNPGIQLGNNSAEGGYTFIAQAYSLSSANGLKIQPGWGHSHAFKFQAVAVASQTYGIPGIMAFNAASNGVSAYGNAGLGALRFYSLAPHWDGVNAYNNSPGIAVFIMETNSVVFTNTPGGSNYAILSPEGSVVNSVGFSNGAVVVPGTLNVSNTTQLRGLTFESDDQYNIGTSTGKRPKHLYLAEDANIGGLIYGNASAQTNWQYAVFHEALNSGTATRTIPSGSFTNINFTTNALFNFDSASAFTLSNSFLIVNAAGAGKWKVRSHITYYNNTDSSGAVHSKLARLAPSATTLLGGSGGYQYNFTQGDSFISGVCTFTAGDVIALQAYATGTANTSIGRTVSSGDPFSCAHIEFERQ